MNKTTVALYARVSKRLGQSIENQLPILEKFAKDKGYEYEIFTEQESTRKTRPVREQVIFLLREGKFDGLVCTRLDRFLRSTQEVILIEEMVKRKRFVAFCQQGLYFSDDAGAFGAIARLQLQILAAFAEFERELIRERTFEGLDRARAEHKTLGRPRKNPPLKNSPPPSSIPDSK
jgi:DNA invertase Pin-like site-specific DNA recombinase